MVSGVILKRDFRDAREPSFVKERERERAHHHLDTFKCTFNVTERYILFPRTRYISERDKLARTRGGGGGWEMNFTVLISSL